MAFLIESFRKDLARWRQDAAALLMWLAIPLVIGGMITAMMDGGGGVKPQGTLLITDLDDSLLSNAVSAVFSQGALAELIIAEQVTAEEGRARIDGGEASGLLTIPKGFGQALLDKQPVELSLVTNPAQTILPGIIEDVIEVLLDAGFYVQELLGDEIALIAGLTDNPDDATVAQIAAALNQKIVAAGVHLFPPAFDVEIIEPEIEKPLAMSLLFFPGIVVMAITFFSNAFAGDYWAERQGGTLRRLLNAPSRLGGLMLGKALAVGVAVGLVGSITLLSGFLYHDVEWAKFPPLLALTVMAGIALFAWFSFLQMLASSQRGANILTTIALFPLLMLGGSFFPFAAMPESLAAVGRLTPNGFVVSSMNVELTQPGSWLIGIGDWLLLAAIMAAGLLLSGWRLRAGFARAT